MKGFIKAYVERNGLLGQALEICEGTSRLDEFVGSVYEC